MKEKVLVIDGGGRGSALVDAYAKSSHVGEIYAVPGNDMMQDLTEKPVHIFPDLKTIDVFEIVEICRERKISLVDVAQDNAVQVGVVDALTQVGINVVGPTKDAGEIEWSKIFARRLGKRVGLPQPKFKAFDVHEDEALFLEKQGNRKWFVKADGLAEGKAVYPAKSNKEARMRVWDLRKNFGKAAERFLLEEWLEGDDGSEGEEFSAFYLSDGKNVRHLGDAQDYKRISNFDTGANTGGMGCSSPPLVLNQEIKAENQEIVETVIQELSNQGREYKGVIYLGGMLVKRGGALRPYVIEFNARWGDPEAQVIIPGIKSDMFELGMATALGDISQINIETDSRARVAVVGAARGYPGNYKEIIGKEIFGLEDAAKIEGVKIYGAGVRKEGNRYFVNGGRLFNMVGEGDNVIGARQKAYASMSLVFIEGNNLVYRTDIGHKDVAHLRTQILHL